MKRDPLRLCYDTIRYDTVDLRALKSWRDGQLNLAHGPETKNNGKNQNQKPSSSEETVQAKVRGGSPGGRRETKGGRIWYTVYSKSRWQRNCKHVSSLVCPDHTRCSYTYICMCAYTRNIVSSKSIQVSSHITVQILLLHFFAIGFYKKPWWSSELNWEGRYRFCCIVQFSVCNILKSFL